MTEQTVDPFARAVAITGVGMITSLGRGVDANWRGLTAGASGIHWIERFSTDGLRTRIAGCVDFMSVDPITIPSLSYAMADAVIAEAMDGSGLGAECSIGGDLFLAAPPIEHDWVSRLRLLEAVDPGGEGPYARDVGVSGTEKNTRLA